ncbi:maltose alpha-D-glucosyltransferase [Chitinispirillales bacterium ANBcel5]|uniref:maltose alpha-D-glucosyltransferase n=1 Tax=Cellulosispirillum alkaliphilum TaxID=3039283 RepID=UPI002A553798|nr:maltose alpha-D-glucosyltransferase [Chitinispirillales bacterium ANBcel5]
MPNKTNPLLINDPHWYREAVIYQLHVKAFSDQNGDGIGDFPGLTQKLDYIQSLGVTAIWILPFYPSPLRDDGYDIADYTNVHPSYGTMRDFKIFLKAAHKRGLRVITELVLNHTSDQHEWFKKSRHAPPGSYWRDFYVWSDTAEKYKDARIIFKDFESSNWSWDSTAQAYFWHRFYSHQPDLNYDNPAVHQEMLRVIDFWFDLGVDGMRLDAVPYLYERDGTNCENLPETFEFLKKIRAHIDSRYNDKMLLAEANQWPEDAAKYFGTGDMCHMAFHFPIMPRMFMALQMEDWFPLVDIMEQTKPIPQPCQWAIFLRNHDELTLEMVTDEERDYMYRCYANDPTARINLGIRRRLAPLLRNSRRRIEIMNILLFSMPGTPIVYYGDEIGMGDNHYLGDRNGVRTPMQWNADRNAGFSLANPQRLYLPVIIDPEYHYEALNVETQEQNTSSLLWWMKRVISMRRKYKAFATGETEFIKSDNANVLTFTRKTESETILVIVNLSRFSQAVSLDLTEYTGYVPVDVFSGNRFPAIRDSNYIVTMGFHDYFWFVLEKEEKFEKLGRKYTLPEFTINKCWTELFNGHQAAMIEKHILPSYLQARKTAGCKHLPVLEARITEQFISENGEGKLLLLFILVKYPKGVNNLILLPLSACSADSIESAVQGNTGMIVAKFGGDKSGYIYDCAFDQRLHQLFFKLMTSPRRLQGLNGFITGHNSGERQLKSKIKDLNGAVEVIKTGPNNSSFSYNDMFHFRLYRQLDEGIRPDVEITRFLSQKTGRISPIPSFMGALEYRGDKHYIVIGVLSKYVSNTGTAWSLSLDAAVNFFESIIAQKIHSRQPPPVNYSLLDANPSAAPQHIDDLIGAFSHKVRLMGTRTAELHLALASEKSDPSYCPEPFTFLYQRSLYQSMRTTSRRIITQLRKKLHSLPESLSVHAKIITDNERLILQLFELLLTMRPSSSKTRIHGDYRLDQLLHIGNDFVIKDFAGQAHTALSERRLKRSPLRDVAGVINSFHCVALTALYRSQKMLPVAQDNLHRWADLWTVHMVNLFLDSYLEKIGESSILPSRKDELSRLLKLFLVEKSLTELDRALRSDESELAVAIRAVTTAINTETNVHSLTGS